jgi:hypothetical protein
LKKFRVTTFRSVTVAPERGDVRGWAASDGLERPGFHTHVQEGLAFGAGASALELTGDEPRTVRLEGARD